MTLDQVQQKAIAVWGFRRVFRVSPRRSGGFYVYLRPDWVMHGGPPLALRDRDSVVHIVDAHGVPVCHADCRSLVGLEA